MKKVLAILAAAIMLLGVMAGAMAQPANRDVAPVAQATRAVKPQAEKASNPLVEKKTANVKAGETLDQALNVSGGTFAFVSTGDYPWTVVDDGTRVYAQSSNAGVPSSTSVVSTTVTVGSNKSVKFEFRAFGEGSSTVWDKCIFAIDGNAQFTYGQLANDWTEFVGNIGPGEHTLTWTYSKDGSVDPNGDYFAVDNVEIVEREALPIDPALDAALNISGGDIHFYTGGDYPWTDQEDENAVPYAANGNSGVHSSVSELTATVMANAGDLVNFDFKAWGESSSSGAYIYDHCRFYVDGTAVMDLGAYDNENWETFNYELTAGEHELKWSYQKDSSTNPEGDYFYVRNVFVSAPIAVTSITAPAMIEVPMYRTGVIEYTVLPANATNKSVTFTSADPTVATVDANGRVKGVAVGQTTVTIASVNYPGVTATVTVKVFDAGITPVTIYGDVVYDPDEVLSSVWVSFTDMDPGTLTQIGAAPSTYGMTYAYGNIYGYTQEGVFFTLPFSDIANTTDYVGSTVVFNGKMRSMSIDYTSGILYGIGSDTAGSTMFLCAMDMDTGAVTQIGNFSVTMLTFAIDVNGTAYGIASDGNLYTINLETAAITLVGSTGLSVGYVQDMCFDYDTGDLYWAHCNDTDGDLIRIDPTNAGCEILGNIGPGDGCEVVGMFIVPANEPAKPANIAVTGVTVTPAEAEIRVGDTASFAAVITPFNASNKNVEWAVDDEDVIVVDQNGTVLGISAGVATVYVTTEDGAFTAYATVNVLPPLGSLINGYYFETDPALDGWIFVDDDGDGYNWGWDTANYTPYEGSGIIYSNSYVNGVGALSPDNWAVSPLVILPGDSADVTFYAQGQDSQGYDAENFAVYVGTTADVSRMTKVGGDYVTSYGYSQYSVNLSAYAGQAVYFALRHYNITDMYILDVDQVEFWGSGAIEGAHTLTINYEFEDGTEAAPTYTAIMPEGFAYSIASPAIEGYIVDPAVVEGVMGENDVTVTVTYTSDGSVVAAGWFFETDPAADGWIFIDDDGDGYNWIWQQDYSNPPYCTAYEGEGLIYSESYHNTDDSGVVLTPDNWAISPAVTLPTGDAEVYLYAQGQDGSGSGYDAEVFAIYVGTSQNTADMVKVSEDFVTEYGYQKFTADLSDYAGQTVYIAIRHYNVTDMFILDVDNVVVKGHDGDTPPAGLPGDVNLDGQLTFADVALLYQFILGQADDLEPQAIINADVNLDGATSMLDVAALYQIVLGS